MAFLKDFSKKFFFYKKHEKLPKAKTKRYANVTSHQYYLIESESNFRGPRYIFLLLFQFELLL